MGRVINLIALRDEDKGAWNIDMGGENNPVNKMDKKKRKINERMRRDIDWDVEEKEEEE